MKFGKLVRGMYGGPRGLWLLVIVVIAGLCVEARAGGVRWYTGPPFYTASQGIPVVFFTTEPRYFTDPGNLNAKVSHAQADAMVAAAAAVWNVPTSRLTLAQGGTLSEHVSGANTFFDGTKLVVPDDVKLVNYLLKPIAIVYDTDGSVIDTLLGSGASDPSGCRLNAVVEDIDGLDPDGTLHHAVLLLNGRCVGADPDQMTQMQYLLTRAFGRVIGLAWSQLNDNVFTGVPRPSAAEVDNWPLMHPIDVVCGTYTYKCMAHPFTLRTDDLSALAQLYPVTSANITPGKTLSADGACYTFGFMYFPNGQAMDDVNVVLRRQNAYEGPDAALLLSAVSGMLHQQFMGNPVTGGASGPAQSNGRPGTDQTGEWFMQRIPIVGPVGWNVLNFTTEPINPLYSGDYALAGYMGDPITVSGSPVIFQDSLELPGRSAVWFETAADAVSACNPGRDGTESSPAAADPSGWWASQMCGEGHTSWRSQTVKGGRTWTLEVSAVDEAGLATTGKVHPLLGVWKAGDPGGTRPTVAMTAGPFNSLALGVTQLHMDATTQAASVRIAIADERGRGRPDFAYKARLLYADSVAPAQISPAGGRFTISGEGFRSGNQVAVNGVQATVLNWTATTITAIAPAMSVARMTATGFADVAVLDGRTGGTTTITGAISYTGTTKPDTVTLVSAPAQVQTGVPSSVAFAVRVTGPDGVTPAVGASVQFGTQGVAATFASCGAATCVLTTDAGGLAQSVFTGMVAGTLTLTAVEMSGGASVQAMVLAVDPVRRVTSATASRYLAAGARVSWSTSVNATVDGVAQSGVSVAWTAGPGLTVGAGSSLADATGTASVAVSTIGLAGGTQSSVSGCAWVTVCASAVVFGVDPTQWSAAILSGAGQTVVASATLAPVTFQVTDAAGHPLQGATVIVYQTVDAWEGVCPGRGRCAAAPVLASSKTTTTTDANGMVAVTPLEVPGVASVVHIAVATGTQGFVSLSLTKTP